MGRLRSDAGDLAGLPPTRFSTEEDTLDARARIQSPDFDVFIPDSTKPVRSGGELIAALRGATPRYVPAMRLSAVCGNPLPAPRHELDSCACSGRAPATPRGSPSPIRAPPGR